MPSPDHRPKDDKSAEPYGLKALPELYASWASTGMVANLGTRLVEVKKGSLILEGNLTAEAHGFPTSRGIIVHGGAIATLADEALASAAYTLAGEAGPAARARDRPSPDAAPGVLRSKRGAGRGRGGGGGTCGDRICQALIG